MSCRNRDRAVSWRIPFPKFGIRTNLDITKNKDLFFFPLEKQRSHPWKPWNISCSPSWKTSAVKWDQQPVFQLAEKKGKSADIPKFFINSMFFCWKPRGAGMRQLCLVGAGCYWSFPWKPINKTWRGR